MNFCLNCGLIVKNKYCNTSCQNSYSNSIRFNKKLGLKKEFFVKCETCDKVFSLIEREKKFDHNKKRYCSHKCRNSNDEIRRKNSISLKGKFKGRILSNETRKKISISVKENKQRNRKTKIFKILPMDDYSELTYIYTLSFNDEIKYVGKSDNPENRLNSHLKSCKKRKTLKEKWIFSLKKQNFEPKLEILDVVPKNNWSFYESYWINQLKVWGYNLLNGTDGGEGSNGFKGKKHSIETKLKCSKSSQKLKKLNKQQVIEILNSREKDIKKLSELFKVSNSTILRVLNGKYKI